MSGYLPFDDIVVLTLCGLYDLVAIDGLHQVDTMTIATKIGENITASSIRMALEQLAAGGAVSNLAEGERLETRLTSIGAREVERMLSESDSFITQYRSKGQPFLEGRRIASSVIPASDRIVSKNDNMPAFEALTSDLDELADALRTSNEVGEAFGEAREIALQEVSFLKSLIASSRLRVEPILAYAKRSLSWIGEKSGSAAISEIAKRALTHLIEWLF